MPWQANVVYSTPTDRVIAAFQRLGLGDALYVVRDLEGIRFQWAREQFFEKTTSEIRHGLPAGGLRAVMPPTPQTNYDDNTPLDQRAARAQRDEQYGDDPANKWERLGFPGRARIPELRTELEWPTGLHDALLEIANQTGD